ncbi:MAG TPA: hypothetical protein VN703_01775 [Candidatus Sulfopaludibacter sp.]|nr:hypothetical protein [Candidatus Sulfopaludibacter sp.]
MFKNTNQKIKTNIVNLIFKFNEFTYIIEKFIDNEKKEFSKIIKEFWIEHQITDLLKISIFLLLILWICFLIYFDARHSYVTFDDLAQAKSILDEIIYINKTQEEIIEIQNEKINQMSGPFGQNKPSPTKYAFAMTVVIASVFSVGFISGFVTMLTMVSMGR